MMLFGVADIHKHIKEFIIKAHDLVTSSQLRKRLSSSQMEPSPVSRLKFSMVESVFDLKKIVVNSSFIINWLINLFYYSEIRTTERIGSNL